MSAGDVFSPSDRAAIDRAVRNAEHVSGARFSVYVGETEADIRQFAEATHGRLSAPEVSVLVVIDPAGRRLEIVCGAEIGRRLDDSACALAALSMQTAFVAGDFVGGICTGVQQMGERARSPRLLHTDTP